MEALNRQQLMACLVLSETLWRGLIPWLNNLNLDLEENASFRVWSLTINDYYNRWRRLPGVSEMSFLAQPHIESVLNTHNQMAMIMVSSDCGGAVKIAEEFIVKGMLDPEISGKGRELLSEFVKEQITHSYIVRMQKEPGKSAQLANDLKSALSAVDGSISIDFATQFPNGYFPERPEDAFTPVGLAFVDKMLAGGLIEGEVVGHSAPIGQGKTTLVSQVIYSRAMSVLSKRKVEADRLGLPDINWTNLPQIYFCVYEKVENLLANFISNAAHIPRDICQQAMFAGTRVNSPFTSSSVRKYRSYEEKQYSKQLEKCREAESRGETNIIWPGAELERFDNAVRVIDRMIQIIDFSGHNEKLREYSGMGVAGMNQYIQAHQDHLKSPGVSLVAVDFAGAVIDNAVLFGKMRQSDRVHEIRTLPNTLGRELAAPFHTPVWIAHQLNPNENKKALGTVPDPHSAEGSGMFLTYCSVGIASGRLSRDNVAVFVAGKQRRVQTTDMDIQLGRLDNMYARWIHADEFALSEKQIVPKRELFNSSLRLPPAGGAINGSPV